ncbi:MAG: amidohydrolase [Acidobacteria bacterium]|nr:amidohydrolase [Acidobacteriota bacterium]
MIRKLTLTASLVAIIVAGLACVPWRAQAQSDPDTILFNGKIITVDRNFSYAEAISIAGGKIVAVGTNDEIRKTAGTKTRQLDLHGKVVIPGLADNHLHDVGGGPGVDLSRVRDLHELLEAIQARVLQSKPGDLIVTNSDWHEAQLKEQTLPLRRDLDPISPENPVVVVRGGHEYILNSLALNKWEINENTRIPDGGGISRYPDGTLNGEIMDTAKSLVHLPPPPQEDLETRIKKQQEAFQILNAAGLTSIRIPGAPVEQYRLLQEMEHRGLMTMRVNFLIRLGGVNTPQDVVSRIASWKVKPDEGDDWLRIWGVKLGVDGGFEGGWMTEPYEEPYGKGGTYKGLQTAPQDKYTMITKELSRRGWRVATHAVGDAAIREVLTAYQEANTAKPITGRRWSIEHAFLPTMDQFPVMNQLGLMISAQNHLYLAGPSLVKYWGAKRANWVTPLRTYLDDLNNKMAVSAGTDSPVVPYPPLWTIYHFVTRDTISGGILGKDQRISREEALRLSTINNAYLNFEEKVKGSLEVGKVADLVVLSDDIMTCPEERIRDMSVLMTMVGGKIVYQHKDVSF